MWIQKLCCWSHSRDRDGGSRAWRVLLRGTWSEAVAHWGQVGISLIAWYRPHFTQDDPGDTLTLPLTPPWGWHWWFQLLWEQWTYPPNFMAIVQIFVEIFKSRKWWKDWYCNCHVDSDWAKLNDIDCLYKGLMSDYVFYQRKWSQSHKFWLDSSPCFMTCMTSRWLFRLTAPATSIPLSLCRVYRRSLGGRA